MFSVPSVSLDNQETAAGAVLKNVVKYLKVAMSFSGASLPEANGSEPEQQRDVSGADEYFDEADGGDARLKGLSAEEAVVRSKRLIMEDTARAVTDNVRSVFSMGEVEMSEVVRFTSVYDPQEESEISVEEDSLPNRSMSGASGSGSSIV